MFPKVPQPFRSAWLKYSATQALTSWLCLCHMKQFQTKLTHESVDEFHHTLLAKNPVCLPFEKYFLILFYFLFLCISMYEYTHIQMGAYGSQGYQVPQSWLQAMRAMLSGTGTKVWTSVKVARVFNTEATLQPPYSCLSMATAVWFLDRCMCYSYQPKSRKKSLPDAEYRWICTHGIPQLISALGHLSWVKGLRVREKTQSRRERWGQSWYVVNTISDQKKPKPFIFILYSLQKYLEIILIVCEEIKMKKVKWLIR